MPSQCCPGWPIQVWLGWQLQKTWLRGVRRWLCWSLPMPLALSPVLATAKSSIQVIVKDLPGLHPISCVCTTIQMINTCPLIVLLHSQAVSQGFQYLRTAALWGNNAMPEQVTPLLLWKCHLPINLNRPQMIKRASNSNKSCMDSLVSEGLLAVRREALANLCNRMVLYIVIQHV